MRRPENRHALFEVRPLRPHVAPGVQVLGRFEGQVGRDDGVFGCASWEAAHE